MRQGPSFPRRSPSARPLSCVLGIFVYALHRWRLFWTNFKRVRREDPVFGSMLSMGDYWEGHATFSPTVSKIEVFVDGGPHTNMELQHKAFQQISDLWPVLENQFATKLQEVWRQRYPADQTASAWEHFTVSALNIPEAPLEDSNWEIDFATERDEHLFTFSMKGREIIAFSMNG